MDRTIKTVFFDWGGVVASDPADNFLGELLHNLGASEQQTHAIFATYLRQFMRGKISETQFWHDLRKTYGLSPHDNIEDTFLKWKGLNANPAVITLVDELRADNYKVALLSNMLAPTYRALITTGYFAHFDACIISCDVGFAKPEPAIYQLALERLHTTGEQSLFIDDKQRNLDAAEAFGFSTILARSSAQIIQDVRKQLAMAPEKG